MGSRVCSKTFLYVLIIMCGSTGFGFIIAYPSASIQSIKDEYGPFTTFEIASFQSIPAIVAVVAPFAFNFALKKWNRKIVSCFIGYFGCVTWLLLLVMNKRLFWLGVFIRGLHGIILAGIALCCPLYINIIAPDGTKGFYGPFHIMGITSGHVISNLLGTLHNWRYPIYATSFLLFMHGSLIWLIPNFPHDTQASKGTAKKLENIDDDESNADSNGEVKNIKPVDVTKNNSKHCAKSNIKPLIVGCVMMSMNQLSGIGGINQNISPLMSEVGLSIDPGFQSAIAQSSQLFSCSIGSLMLDKFGPKLMWIISSTGNTLSLLIYALNVKFEWSPWIPMIMLFGYQTFFGFGLSPIPTTVVPSMLSPAIKSTGMTLGTVSNRLAGAIMLFLFPYLREWVGQFGLMLILAIINFLCLIFGIIFVPKRIEQAGVKPKEEHSAESLSSDNMRENLIKDGQEEGEI
ncbi:major facilitator superfamily transporter [Tritrichomonas foetus]|uniref:Major facilitator superfamily transporter n=1 Tax=Tritrichomonas foetus TaxID=1144522 RepID=A0A1J4JJC6_9EUKA|nr:major facilitator superfamily transporter [Tritrichomonas foetus]|eukprot:OHS98439.1 major facilitator superfamily transporter [Tritrichomonas foetus]